MGRFLIVFALMTTTSIAEAGIYINQGTHVRRLIVEKMKGSWIDSIYNADHGTVILEYCRRREPFSGCRRIHGNPVKISDLGYYQGRLMEEFQLLRDQIFVEVSTGWFGRLFDPNENRNVLALQAMIEQIESETLANWLKLGPERAELDFSSRKISDRVAQVFGNVLKETPPVKGPKDEPQIATGR